MKTVNLVNKESLTLFKELHGIKPTFLAIVARHDSDEIDINFEEFLKAFKKSSDEKHNTDLDYCALRDVLRGTFTSGSGGEYPIANEVRSFTLEKVYQLPFSIHRKLNKRMKKIYADYSVYEQAVLKEESLFHFESGTRYRKCYIGTLLHKEGA